MAPAAVLAAKAQERESPAAQVAMRAWDRAQEMESAREAEQALEQRAADLESALAPARRAPPVAALAQEQPAAVLEPAQGAQHRAALGLAQAVEHPAPKARTLRKTGRQSCPARSGSRLIRERRPTQRWSGRLGPRWVRRHGLERYPRT
jgi:hypothetical protein